MILDKKIRSEDNLRSPSSVLLLVDMNGKNLALPPQPKLKKTNLAI